MRACEVGLIFRGSSFKYVIKVIGAREHIHRTAFALASESTCVYYIMVSACIMIIIHACTIFIVFACARTTVHAYITMVIRTCIRIIVSACFMIIMHVVSWSYYMHVLYDLGFLRLGWATT